MVKGKKRKTTKDYGYIRRPIRRYNKANICSTNSVSPDVMAVQLTFVQQRLLNSLSNNFADWTYRGNSIHDPDQVSSTNNRPLGYREWATLYRKYRVKACKIHVNFSNSSSVPMVCGVTASNEPGGAIVSEQLQESKFTKTVLVGTSSHGVGTVQMKLSTAQVRGGPSNIVEYESDLSALFNSNPVNQWYFDTWARSMDGSTTIDVDTSVTITYFVEMFDRQLLEQSIGP